MNYRSLAEECLNGFHLQYTENDSKPELSKLSAFKKMMLGDYSGKNLKSKILDSDFYWDQMLETKGFGRRKYEKAQDYRAQLWMAWREIEESFESGDEVQISATIGKYIWCLNENDYKPSLLGVLESAILLNKLWKNENMADIFVDYFGFLFDHTRSIDEIAERTSLTRERIRQLKNHCINTFESKFWFFQEEVYKDIFDEFVEVEDFRISSVQEFTDSLNLKYDVNFTARFYVKVISFVYKIDLLGNVNDTRLKHRYSSSGNVWSGLYLWTSEDMATIDLEKLINDIAVIIHDNSGYFKRDIRVELASYALGDISNEKMEMYSEMLRAEIDVELEIDLDAVVIKRNSRVQKHEYVEEVLEKLGGLAYLDDILLELNESSSSDVTWSEAEVRSAILSQDHFYTVGKSRLYGLKDVKDVREKAGDGTMNDIMRIHLLSQTHPVHMFDLLRNVNQIFPRNKSIHSLHSFLEQNSRDYFVKFSGGFYGLKGKKYTTTVFPKVRGFHGRILRDELRSTETLSFVDLLDRIKRQVDILPIQLEYLLFQALETGELKKVGENYQISYALDDIQEGPLASDSVSQFIYSSIEDFEFDDDLVTISNFHIEPAVQVYIRRGQPKFRRGLLRLYNSQCIVTGCKIIPLLEAAHIIPHSKQVNYSLSNGLLLRSDIHTLFDTNLIAINPISMRTEVHASLLEDALYSKYQNIDIGFKVTRLHPDYGLNKRGLLWRWEIFNEER